MIDRKGEKEGHNHSPYPPHFPSHRFTVSGCHQSNSLLQKWARQRRTREYNAAMRSPAFLVVAGREIERSARGQGMGCLPVDERATALCGDGIG